MSRNAGGSTGSARAAKRRSGLEHQRRIEVGFGSAGAVLRRTAERLNMAKSEVVREAVQEYGARVGRLSEAERLRLLTAFDEYVSRIPERPLAEVEAELEEIRRARQRGGRAGGRAGRRGDGRP